MFTALAAQEPHDAQNPCATVASVAPVTEAQNPCLLEVRWHTMSTLA
jgi:hypothetical protein